MPAKAEWLDNLYVIKTPPEKLSVEDGNPTP